MGLQVHAGGRGRDSIMRSGQFETSRKRYNESRTPLQVKGDVRKLLGDGDREFKFDFEFQVPKGTGVDWSGDGKIFVEEKGIDAKYPGKEEQEPLLGDYDGKLAGKVEDVEMR
jgi:hypothetical protein